MLIKHSPKLVLVVNACATKHYQRVPRSQKPGLHTSYLPSQQFIARKILTKARSSFPKLGATSPRYEL